MPDVVVGRRLTFEDYQALPDDQDYEIIDGVLYVSPKPRPRHQIVASELVYLLLAETKASRSGTVVPDADLIINERDVYISPDIMYFAGDRFAAADPDGWVRIIPDLVVEILSPTTEDYDLTTKRRVYTELGVSHYWAADPRQRVLIEHVLQPDGQYEERVFTADGPFRPELFPNLAVDLVKLFP